MGALGGDFGRFCIFCPRARSEKSLFGVPRTFFFRKRFLVAEGTEAKRKKLKAKPLNHKNG